MSERGLLRKSALLCFCCLIAVGAAFAQGRDRIAVKTNLLFDAATALNIELEVSLDPRWSVAGEWIFPWWLDSGDQLALQLGAGTLEGRYWFNGCTSGPRMTGWFAGLYAGGGYYDLEWKKSGRQGELFHTGVSGGYAHTINGSGSLRMEYSLGLGYMWTKYRKYDAVDISGQWILERRTRGTYHWFGPTRAKVSLVWTPDFLYPKKRGGDR